MRYIIVHRTNATWERGDVKPEPALIERVGKMVADMQKANALDGADGLGPSMRGVRLHFSGGACEVTKGPYTASNEIPAGFVGVRVETLDDAVTWAKRLGNELGDVEIDIRPLNEAWDIGVAEKPPGLTTTRYMILHKATADTEKGQANEASKSVEEMKKAGVFLVREQMQPTKKAARVRRSKGAFEVIDGPFTEAKEMVGGYVVVVTSSKDEAVEWAKRYVEAVDVDEVDVLELR